MFPNMILESHWENSGIMHDLQLHAQDVNQI